MAQPTWITPAGILAEINEGETYTKALVANDIDYTDLVADATDVSCDSSLGTTDGFLPLVFSIIAGSLPTGLALSSGGTISGTPGEVAIRTEKQFVVRASNGTTSADRTFTLFVEGSDAPTWTTAAGSLGTIADGQFFNFQLQASDTDGDIKFYRFDKGNLPNEVVLNTQTGLLSGVIRPIALESLDSSQIGFDAVAFDQTQQFDQIIRLGSIDTNYEFTISVSDGINYTPRTFSIFVKGTSTIKADTLDTFADTTAVTSDASDIRGIIFTTPAGLLATIKHQNYNIIKIDTEDPDDYLGVSGIRSTAFSLVSGTLPTGMSLDPSTGELFGTVPTFVASETTFTFTIRATKTVVNYEDNIAEREFSVIVQGAGYGQITWDTAVEELNI